MIFYIALGVSAFIVIVHAWYRRMGKKTEVKIKKPEWIELAEMVFLLLLFIECASQFGIEVVLVLMTLISGLVALSGWIMKKTQSSWQLSKQLNEQMRGFFPILLVILLLRSFLLEPYRIPTGSLIPTLLIGDFILVNKFDYGLRLPVWRKKIVSIGEPKVGDIMVFLWPLNPSIYLVKRVIGVPGDRVSYRNKVVYINGKPMSQKWLANKTLQEMRNQTPFPVTEKQEDLLGVKHNIYLRNDILGHDMPEMVIPAGHYFMMGDNRDNSFDSRGWGLVPEENIVGKVTRIIFSWDDLAARFGDKIRIKRIGEKVQ